jgi:hypothetical protein
MMNTADVSFTSMENFSGVDDSERFGDISMSLSDSDFVIAGFPSDNPVSTSVQTSNFKQKMDVDEYKSPVQMQFQVSPSMHQQHLGGSPVQNKGNQKMEVDDYNPQMSAQFQSGQSHVPLNPTQPNVPMFIPPSPPSPRTIANSQARRMNATATQSRTTPTFHQTQNRNQESEMRRHQEISDNSDNDSQGSARIQRSLKVPASPSPSIAFAGEVPDESQMFNPDSAFDDIQHALDSMSGEMERIHQGNASSFASYLMNYFLQNFKRK